MAVLFTSPYQQFLDDDGNPLAGGKVYTYDAGTTTPRATYTTAAASVQNANPVVLDSSGRAVIFIDGSYRFDVKDADGALIESVDNISSFSVSTGPTLTSMTASTLKGNPSASTADAVDIPLGAGVAFSGGRLVGMVAQVVETGYTTASSGTTVIPSDDTIPQNTEGDEYITASITPTNANNLLYIEALIYAAHSVTDVVVIAALFQDSTAGALCAGLQYTATADFLPIVIRHRMTAGTTSETTFKIRVGCGTAGTTYVNRIAGGRLLGGVLRSSLRITEIKV